MEETRRYYVEQTRDHNIWVIVELFYRSHIVFREQFERYEWRVLQHSYQKGLDRLDLRLNPDDLAALLDFKALERLRDDYIHILKDTCHLVFRGEQKTDVLDRYVADIFHEISILKEEHYNVKTYAPQYARDAAETELSYILDEAHQMFPTKLNHIRFLFQRAQSRMEELLPSFVDCKILVRSLYLNRDDFIAQAYDNGIRDVYAFMYPDLKALKGFYEAAESFRRAGFYPRALEAYRHASREAGQVELEDDKARLASEALAARIGEQIEELANLTEGSSNDPDGEATTTDREAGLLS